MSEKTTSQKLSVLRNQFHKEVEKLFKESLEEFFSSHPKAHYFAVPAYTPYFNDGDACTYSVHRWGVEVNDYSDDNDVDDTGMTDEEHQLAVKDARKLIDQFDDDDFKFLAQEEGLVTFYKDGTIEVQDYDHD